MFLLFLVWYGICKNIQGENMKFHFFFILLCGYSFFMCAADSDTSTWSVQQFTDMHACVWEQYDSLYAVHGAIIRACRRYDYDIVENPRLTPLQKARMQEEYLEFKRTHKAILARDEKYHAYLTDLDRGKSFAWDRRHRG